MYKVKSLVLVNPIKMPPYSKTYQFYMEDPQTKRKFDVEYDDVGEKVFITPKRVAGSHAVATGVYILPFQRVSYIQLYEEDLKRLRRQDVIEEISKLEEEHSPKTPIILPRKKIRTGSRPE